MLKHRLIFGSALLLVTIALFWLDGRINAIPLDGPWRDLFAGREHPPAGLILFALGALIITFAAGELADIFGAKGLRADRGVIALAPIAAAATLYAAAGATVLAGVQLACFFLALVWHCRRAEVEGAAAAAAATMFAAAYLGLTLGFFLLICREHGGWVVLGILLVTKSGDIGAYFTGRAIGRRKLIPWLSPGKTWEGLFGGVGLAALVAVGLAFLSQHTDIATVHDAAGRPVVHRYHPGWAALAGFVIALVGHAGDLAMSLFKRDARIKDSGTVAPGFGGILDVTDSPLLVAPVAYWMLVTWTG